MRVSDIGRDGFVLTDFPRSVGEAELLEEFRGGINSFVHLSIPDDIMVAIEESKYGCNHCGRLYYTETIVGEEQGIFIEPFAPHDGHCFDCGSRDITPKGEPTIIEEALKIYKGKKDDLLGFYDHLGLLVDYEIKHGFEDYDKIRDQIQFNIKH